MALHPRQELTVRALLAIVSKVGSFDQRGPAGADYLAPTENKTGFQCLNCAFWAQEKCKIVKGKIDAAGICRFRVITQLTQGEAPSFWAARKKDG